MSGLGSMASQAAKYLSTTGFAQMSLLNSKSWEISEPLHHTLNAVDNFLKLHAHISTGDVANVITSKFGEGVNIVSHFAFLPALGATNLKSIASGLQAKNWTGFSSGIANTVELAAKTLTPIKFAASFSSFESITNKMGSTLGGLWAAHSGLHLASATLELGTAPSLKNFASFIENSLTTALSFDSGIREISALSNAGRAGMGAAAATLGLVRWAEFL